MARKTSSGKRMRFSSAAAIFVAADVGERRDEAREQIAVGRMHLHHVEAGAMAALGRRDVIGDHLVHVGARHLARNRAMREIGQGRRRDDRPCALGERLVDALPHQLGRALAAGMAELQAELGLRLRVHEIDDALPRRLVRVAVHAGATRRDARLLRHVGHLGEHQAGAADRARAIVDEVPIVRHAVLRRVLAHRRHHDAVLERQPAQAERLEHRRERLRGVGVKTERAHVAGDHPVRLLDEFGRAQRQVVVGDGLGARHQAEGEAGRVHVPEPVDVLEPNERDVGRVLGLLHLLAPPGSRTAPARPRRPARPSIGTPRTARSRPPSRAWCRSRWRNARSPWHRRSAPCCRRPSARSGWSGNCARSSGW